MLAFPASLRNLYKLMKRVHTGYDGHSGRATPVLIPNTAVKPSSDSGCTAIGGNPETLSAHYPKDHARVV